MQGTNQKQQSNIIIKQHSLYEFSVRFSVLVYEAKVYISLHHFPMLMISFSNRVGIFSRSVRYLSGRTHAIHQTIQNNFRYSDVCYEMLFKFNSDGKHTRIQKKTNIINHSFWFHSDYTDKVKIGNGLIYERIRFD